MRRLALIAASVAVLTLLSGCAILSELPPVPSASPTSPTAPSDPHGAALLGTWSVSAAGTSATWVRFEPGGALVARGGHVLGGGWDAADGLTTADVVSWDGAFGSPSLPWLTQAHAYRTDGRERALLDAAGRVLAVLRPTPSAPAADVRALEEWGGRGAASPEPLPSRPAGMAPRETDLLGRWVTGVASRGGGRPSLTFSADGTYAASDGCNVIAGSWAVLPDGRLLRTSGLNGDVGCANLVPVDEWVARARSVRVQGRTLVLYDVRGRSIGSLLQG